MAIMVMGRAAAATESRRGVSVDWIGFILLATFMIALVFALHALPDARAAPTPLIGFAALAAGALVALVIVEARIAEPLVDRKLFAQRDFVMGLAIGSLAMFSIMSLLLYFNLYAQSPEGLGLTALEADAALLPLSVSLLALALFASGVVAGRIGRRRDRRDGLIVIAASLSARRCERRRPSRWASGCLRWARVWPCLRLGAALGALGAVAGAEGTGGGSCQCVHLSWRLVRVEAGPWFASGGCVAFWR